MPLDVDLLRQIARGESFRVGSFASAEMAAFQLLADQLFELEGRGLITIRRPDGISSTASNGGGYTAVTASITPAGKDILATIGG
jgi:hypothetical protein